MSEALYGTYGRPRGFLGFCQAPFYQHSTVSGDLAECQSELLKFTGKDLESVDQVLDQPGESPGFQDYIDRVASLYEQADVKGLEDDYDQLSRFQVRLFEEMVGFKLSSSYLDTDNASTIMEIRREFEDQRYAIEETFQAEEMAVGEFLDGYNHLTLDFQYQLADALSESDYRRLLGLNRDETVVLGDPDIIHQAYNRGG